MKKPEEEFKDIVASYAKLFNCCVSVHDYNGAIAEIIQPICYIHLNDFCVNAGKKISGKSCLKFDIDEVREHFLKGGTAMMKICHAGVLEFVAPVIAERRLCGVLFLGPFKIDSLKKIRVDLFQKPVRSLNRREEKLMQKLSLLEPSQRQSLLNMTQLLADRLGHLLESLNLDYVQSRTYAEKIKFFINREFKNSIAMSDLAAFLSLSISRASRIVKIHTGKSFPELLSERRIEYAKFLLQYASLSTERVSKACGFSSPPYFFKIFKMIEKISPAEYRVRSREKAVCSNV